MANSTTNLDLISASQASKEVTANALADAGSPATLFGRRATTTTGLTWGHYGGVLNVAGTPTEIANGTVSLTGSATNYVEATTAGVVSANTSAFTAGRLRLYTVVCGASSVTSYTDHRHSGTGAGIAGGSGTVTSVAMTVPSGFSVSGSPITTSGTLAVTISDAGAARTALGVAIGTDVQAYDAQLADLAGITFAQGDIVYFNGTNLVKLAAGTSGQVLKTQGAGANPVWSDQPFDATAFYPGVPTNSAKVLRVPIARAVTFAGNFSGSYGKASVASTGTATFDVQKNGSSIGTVVFTSSATATFTTTSGAAQSFAAGDVLSIIAPASADATLADIGIVLAGTR